MNKTTMIYGLNLDRASCVLNSILTTLNTDEIERIVKTKNEHYVYMKNGDRYIAKKASNGSVRGHKWQYAIIDKHINDNLLYDTIFANFFPKKANGKIDRSLSIKYCYHMFG